MEEDVCVVQFVTPLSGEPVVQGTVTVPTAEKSAARMATRPMWSSDDLTLEQGEPVRYSDTA